MCVDRGQPLGQTGAQRPNPPRRQRPVPFHRVLQRRPVNVSGDHPRRISLRIRVDHLRGMEAPDLPRRFDLQREPLPELRGTGVRGMDHLDCDLAPPR